MSGDIGAGREAERGIGPVQGNVVGGTIDAPDRYPDWHPDWEHHRSELLKYWSAAKPLIRVDIDKAELIDLKLDEALASFDRGEREPGQSLMVKIYNVLNLNPLR
jgi:hypothetical protein